MYATVPSALPGLVRCSSVRYGRAPSRQCSTPSSVTLAILSPKSSPTPVRYKDVRGLDVPVNDSLGVRSVQCIRDLDAEIEHRFSFQRLAIR